MAVAEHAVVKSHERVELATGQSIRRHPVDGIAYRVVEDLPPSRLVLAWRRADRSPLIGAYADAFCAVPGIGKRSPCVMCRCVDDLARLTPLYALAASGSARTQVRSSVR